MFTADYLEFKFKSAELQRQAENYRLVKSLSITYPLAPRIASVIGMLLIQSGQLLVSRAQA